MTTPTSAPALQCPLKPSGRQSSAWPGSRVRVRQREQRWSLKQPVAFDSCSVTIHPPPHTHTPPHPPCLGTQTTLTHQHLSIVNSSDARTLRTRLTLSHLCENHWSRFPWRLLCLQSFHRSFLRSAPSFSRRSQSASLQPHLPLLRTGEEINIHSQQNQKLAANSLFLCTELTLHLCRFEVI